MYMYLHGKFDQLHKFSKLGDLVHFPVPFFHVKPSLANIQQAATNGCPQGVKPTVSQKYLHLIINAIIYKDKCRVTCTTKTMNKSILIYTASTCKELQYNRKKTSLLSHSSYVYFTCAWLSMYLCADLRLCLFKLFKFHAFWDRNLEYRHAGNFIAFRSHFSHCHNGFFTCQQAVEGKVVKLLIKGIRRNIWVKT